MEQLHSVVLEKLVLNFAKKLPLHFLPITVQMYPDASNLSEDEVSELYSTGIMLPE